MLILLIIDKNLLFKGSTIRKGVLYVKEDFITTCCGGVGFDSGRAERVAKITSKDL